MNYVTVPKQVYNTLPN